jgi:peptidoglycan/LPS O-acetylase OafA/YrhL
MIGPRGEVIPLPLALLEGSPFATYLWPGVILFSVLGLGPLAVAYLAGKRHRWAPLLTVGVGGALLIWLAVEIAIIGYSNDPPLQPFYLALGLALGAVGFAWSRQRGALHPPRVHGG